MYVWCCVNTAMCLLLSVYCALCCILWVPLRRWDRTSWQPQKLGRQVAHDRQVRALVSPCPIPIRVVVFRIANCEGRSVIARDLIYKYRRN